jgi:cyclophilin family peptidyl-prolyl cis-trans isomerase
MLWTIALVTGLLPAAAAARVGQAGKPGAAPAGPVVVIETAKGVIEFETFPEDAPKTVAHILGLVRKNFYRGLRFHRVEKNFVVQAGDPRTRDVTKMDQWGKGPGGGSGTPVGVAEFSKTRTHRRGAVGLAHAGDPKQGDSQFYIMLANRPGLDGKYVVFGQVVRGMEVVDKLEVGDVIKRMYVKADAAK